MLGSIKGFDIFMADAKLRAIYTLNFLYFCLQTRIFLKMHQIDFSKIMQMILQYYPDLHIKQNSYFCGTNAKGQLQLHAPVCIHKSQIFLMVLLKWESMVDKNIYMMSLKY